MEDGGRLVSLRAEHEGNDHRYLTARLGHSGDLLIEGQDLGPATAPVSSDEEYEWVQVVPAARIPELLHVLGAAADVDVLDELAARWTGPGSYELERLLRESELSTLHVL